MNTSEQMVALMDHAMSLTADLVEADFAAQQAEVDAALTGLGPPRV